MNKSQRKELGQLWDRLNAMKTRWIELQSDMSTLKDELDDLVNPEQERFDAMSERVQEGERGQELAEQLNELNNALDGLNGVDGMDLEFDEWLANIDNARGAE